MHEHKKLVIASLLAGIILASIGFFVFEFWEMLRGGEWREAPTFEDLTEHRKEAGANLNEDRMEAFTSEEDFRGYVQAGKDQAEIGLFSAGIGGGDMAVFEEGSGGVAMSVPSSAGMVDRNVEKNFGRYSTTNVQVAGIDEPDMFKSDGEHFFISDKNGRYDGLVGEGGLRCSQGERCFPQPYAVRLETAVVQADPAKELAKRAGILRTGDLLLADGMLIIISGRDVTAYDVSDPANPKESWTSMVPEGKQIEEARSWKGKLYLVESEYVGRYGREEKPLCPIEPLVMKGATVSIPCGEIYHPVDPIEVNSAYSILKIDPKDGSILEKGAFVGASGNMTLMMSGEHIYLSYQRSGDIASLIAGFVEESGLFPQSVVDHVREVRGYSLSQQAKMTELVTVLERYAQGLTKDERLTAETKMENAMSEYLKQHRRDLEFTSIVKIGSDDLAVRATGRVAGRLLNQFSIDEYDGNLRVAATFGGRGSFFGGVAGAASESEVTVLDEDMRVIGSVAGLGKGERIYAARFVGERAFVVTFRETDPFYVLDLSNPRKPTAAGELKIPGYSSYLHPLSETLVLGVGREGSAVKLSLFDVRDATNPTEISKYTFAQEYWSEALNNHRAFLADPKREVVFVPGSRGGYIVSYAGRKLDLAKAIEGYEVKRAAFIDETFYVVSDRRVVALNEDDWSEIKRLEW